MPLQRQDRMHHIECIINSAFLMRKTLVLVEDSPSFSSIGVYNPPITRFIRWTRQLHETEASWPRAFTTITLTATFTLPHGSCVHAPAARLLHSSLSLSLSLSLSPLSPSPSLPLCLFAVCNLMRKYMLKASSMSFLLARLRIDIVITCVETRRPPQFLVMSCNG